MRFSNSPPIYSLKFDVGDFVLKGAPPPMDGARQLFLGMRWNQVETNRFFGVLAGSVPVQEFYSPENIERLIDTRELVAEAA